MKIIRLAPDYQFGSFDCGESDLNEFLLTDAKEYASHLLAVTYIIEDRNDIWHGKQEREKVEIH